jgi:hypothetical protein
MRKNDTRECRRLADRGLSICLAIEIFNRVVIWKE